MQEEVNQKTVALSIRTTKLTGKALAAALGKVVRALQKHHQKALTPQGRQSVKKLMNHYGGKSAMPYVGAPKDFDRIAKEFHVDYAFHKVSPGHYLLFFKANQADAITAAFQKYSAKVLNKAQDKTRPVFEQYKATKYSRKFLAEHEADLELYRAAQAEMRSLLGGAKLPKMDVLKEEGRKLTAKKKQLYGEYQKARRDMQEIVTIKANIDTLMGYTEPGRKQEKER